MHLRRILTAAAVLLSLLLTADVDARRPGKPLTFSILEDYDKGENLQEVARDFVLMRELGVTTWRGSFGWDDYEPERGRYDFTWLHQFAALAAARGITLRPYLGYTPAWAAKPPDRDGQAWNQPPSDQRAWRAFVSAIARELAHHPNVKSLEIYNEENVAQWWEGSRDDYAATLRQASEAARARRRFEILAGGLVFPDLDWVEDLCSDRGTAAVFDVLPIHAYPETWTPEGVTVENYLGSGFAGSFVPGADRACGRKRIWINETGYATTAGRTERDQAEWWIRAVATFAAEPRVEHIGVYEIKDLAPAKEAIGDTPNYHLGITRVDRAKKLAFGTIQMLANLLGSGQLAVEDDQVQVSADGPAGNLHHHAFVNGRGHHIFIVWNRTDSQHVTAGFARRFRVAVEYEIDGRRKRAPAGSRMDLQLAAGVPRVFELTE